MIAPLQQDVFTTPVARHAATQVKQTFRAAAWGLALVEAVIGYEWLLSGLDKVLSAKYLLGLANALGTSIRENPNSCWVAFIQQQVLPRASAWALLAGHGLPGLNPADPFDEGLSLDGVLTAIGLSLLVIHLLAWRTEDQPGETSSRYQVLHDKEGEEHSS